jgi:sec-independent protein translocase protein TatC
MGVMGDISKQTLNKNNKRPVARLVGQLVGLNFPVESAKLLHKAFVHAKQVKMPDFTAPPNPETLASKEMTLWQHLAELRRRLMYCLIFFVISFAGCYLLAEPLLSILTRPLADALAAINPIQPNGQANGQPNRMITTGLAEAFLVRVKAAYYGALLCSLPLAGTQLWRFAAPGLYAEERRSLWPFLIASPILFCLGIAFAYFVVFPAAWHFFVSFQSMTGDSIGGLPVKLEPKLDQYLELVVHFMLAFGLCFQVPVVLLLLIRANILTVQDLRKRRRHAIVAAFVIAAVLTPPDVLSQLSLALPMILLYELSIWCAVLWFKPAPPIIEL